MSRTLFVALYCLAASTLVTCASERYFTYTYEPETMPKGAWESEQWFTLRADRNQAVGQEDFSLWEFRQEIEYGVTDQYNLSLYFNESFESYHDPTANSEVSNLRFDGVSLENRYMLLSPVDHSVGLTLYLEPRISGDQAELEEKIILGQRYGDWKWAFNLGHATEWTDHFHTVEGEVEASLGINRRLNRHWSLGVEARDHNEIPNYSRWENTALYVGPVVTYQQRNWWVSLTVMPQVYGVNFLGNPDQNSHLDLEGHERWNARLIFGASF
jgi:hypothetical protein